MRLVVVAVGKASAGPERELVKHYLDRAGKAGRALGFTAIDLVELGESRLGTAAERRKAEALAILRVVPPGALLIALDERGENLSSAAFAEGLARFRDEGQAAIVCAIGGPDGHGPDLLAAARLKLAFGAATWPHLLARVLLAEQIYRAITILAGHPYHRE